MDTELHHAHGQAEEDDYLEGAFSVPLPHSFTYIPGSLDWPPRETHGMTRRLMNHYSTLGFSPTLSSKLRIFWRIGMPSLRRKCACTN